LFGETFLKSHLTRLDVYPMAGFLLAILQKGIVEASNRRVNAAMLFARHALCPLVLHFARSVGSATSRWFDARVIEILRRSPVRYEAVGSGYLPGIPSGCTWQFRLAQCTNPIYHCFGPPASGDKRGGSGGLIERSIERKKAQGRDTALAHPTREEHQC
jgi:hypothetical protein